MSPPAGQIRLYRAEDERPVRFMIGKAKMEGLATANKKATIHPVTLSIWFGLAALLAEYMQWWPRPEQGMLRYLSPLPAFACTLVLIIALIDWKNRPQFEDITQETLKWPDIPDLLGYYGRSPSGFWVLEFNDNPVGIAAIDASQNAEAQTAIPPGRDNSNGTSETAVLRHFYVDEPYRKADIQKDLLQHVIRHTFTTDTKIRRVKATCSSLTSYLERALKEEGFTLESAEQSLGVFRWKTGIWKLERARFENK
ncbi:hypothetical protein AAF712_000945 [Marasmius tenuissimus]|uniref:N-acetyltransferase domain-containing protein n=1 Tax=Marasmius tenuissimus TaxID=585030 RepID=A0ABR3AF56_9AGAR|nr:hypothetical protein PM082_002832 [Marasmius tenuissimus]